MSNRVRYTVEEVLKNTFYQLPKFLFGDEFKTLCNDGRVLYTLLKDRHELSIKNKWYNEKREVYLIMTREEMGTMLNVSAPTVRKIVQELKDLELIEEVRQGLTKPNLIYLLECKNLSVSNNKNLQSKSEKKYSRENKEFTPINTNQINTDINKTDSINQTAADNNDTIRLNDINSIKKEVADKIELEKVLSTYPQHYNEIKEICGIMVDILSSTKKSFRIAKEDLFASTVKETFSQIDYDHFIYALEGLITNTTKVKNMKAYILTTLYNTIQTYVSHTAMNEQHERYIQQQNQYSGNQETSPGTHNSHADNRIQYKTFDLDHFFKRAVAHSMGT